MRSLHYIVDDDRRIPLPLLLISRYHTRLQCYTLPVFLDDVQQFEHDLPVECICHRRTQTLRMSHWVHWLIQYQHLALLGSWYVFKRVLPHLRGIEFLADLRLHHLVNLRLLLATVPFGMLDQTVFKFQRILLYFYLQLVLFLLTQDPSSCLQLLLHQHLAHQLLPLG